MKIRKEDNVLVIAGKDKGKTGKVIQVAPTVRKILVEGVNLVKKHVPAEKTKGGKIGQRIELPTFLDISNVKLICPQCKKATRVGYSLEGESKKRVCKKCKKNIDE